jgi:predicted nucleic acid-binding protein
MTKIAIDSNIFFFSLKSRQRDVNPRDVERLLRGLSGDPKIGLFVPISVFGESVIECLQGEKNREGHHDIKELFRLIELWSALDLLFLYPNDLVAAVCYQFSMKKEERQDYMLSDTDLVHLGYAMAHEMDYFLTTDKDLKHVDPYIPKKAKLQVIGLDEARHLF